MTLLFFNIGGGEILVLLMVMLLIFGPKQAVDVARKTGKVLNDLKKATQSVKDEIIKEDRKISQQTTVPSPYKEISNIIETVDADYEISKKKKQQELERDKKEIERATTI